MFSICASVIVISMRLAAYAAASESQLTPTADVALDAPLRHAAYCRVSSKVSWCTFRPSAPPMKFQPRTSPA